MPSASGPRVLLEPLVLVGVDRDHRQRPGQLPQMRRSGRDRDQPARRERGSVRSPPRSSARRRSARSPRTRRPAAGRPRCRRPRPPARGWQRAGPAGGVLGVVHRDADPLRKRLEHPLEVVAGPRSEVDDGPFDPGTSAADGRLRDGRGDAARRGRHRARARGPRSSPPSRPYGCRSACRAGSRSPGGRCSRCGRCCRSAKRRSAAGRRRSAGRSGTATASALKVALLHFV